jgi:Cu+-exporting ATPase
MTPHYKERFFEATGQPQLWPGLSLSPVVTGLAMSLSSFFFVTNALRLRAWQG